MRKARAIFQNIYSSEETTEEKENAIRKVIGMETHNSFTKQEFINALDWLLNEHSKHNDWILCSERMPEENELVLIYAESTARGGSVRVVACLHNGFWFTQTSSDTLSLNGIGQYKVIAWQPLPEPYQQKEVG